MHARGTPRHWATPSKSAARSAPLHHETPQDSPPRDPWDSPPNTKEGRRHEATAPPGIAFRRG